VIGPADVAGLRAALLAGGVALVPTDTVYGLAAALDSAAGVERLYAVKGRPRSQPCQVLMYAPGLLAEAIDELPEPIAAGARALLPGPATCLVPDVRGAYAAAAGGELGTVGLRAPATAGPLGALAQLDIPLVATSANEPGGADPCRLDDVPAELRSAVGLGLDAGVLPGTASAVVDLRGAEDGDARIVRPGPDPDGVRRRLAAAGIVLRGG
jgi:L-threonylcarbamoyladenylate synthase